MRFGRSTFSYSAGEPLGDFLVYFDHAPGSGFEDKFEIVSAALPFPESACFQRSDGEFGCTYLSRPASGTGATGNR